MSDDLFINDTEAYRDKIATVDHSGKRIWVYPKKPNGRFYTARTYVSWVLLAILFGLPFIKLHGQPFVLLDVLNRNFILFGVHFAPQDFFLFVVTMLTFLVFIVLFTVIYGRLFCGWVCPQTIFMEMVFRKIEYWIEGDANAQRRLNRAPWTRDKIFRKTAKQAIFILISVLIAHTFLSYIVGLDRVIEIVTSTPSQNLGGFVAMIGFTGAFYFVFSRLREQVCTTICPYGRLQGVMTDKNTILVSYDFARGEPRGKLRRKKQPDPVSHIQSEVSRAAKHTSPDAVIEESPIQLLGDCIDCKLCVQVCPTAIDIRDGEQLECINCTACMDACDEVMDKIGRDRGLIRYDSFNGIVAQRKKIFTNRVKAYSVVLLALIGFNILLFSQRSEVDISIFRTPGILYQQVDNTHISNLYNYQFFNKTAEDLSLDLRLQREAGRIRWVGDKPSLKANQLTEGAFFIELEKASLKSGKNKVSIEVLADGRLLEKVTTSFLGPIK